MNLEKAVADLAEKIERRFYGKYRGFVVDNNDPEQLGRLKLQVPSVLGENIVTGWALPCVPYGGDANTGFFFVPEVRAGVWVEFEEGDLEFPIWTGTFWSKPDGESEVPKPIRADGEKVDSETAFARKIIKTKSHTIECDDEFKDETGSILVHPKIVVKDGVNGHLIVLDKDGITISEGTKGITITDKSKNTITMSNEGISLSHNSGNSISISANSITLKTITDSFNWCPNSLKTCLFTGAPHGGPPIITSLKGS